MAQPSALYLGVTLYYKNLRNQINKSSKSWKKINEQPRKEIMILRKTSRAKSLFKRGEDLAVISSRLPFFLKAFSTSSSKLCLCFLPGDEIYEPFCNSMDISKSAHLVKRLDTKDPYGSTVAPTSTILNINSSNICHQPKLVQQRSKNSL